MTRNSILGRCLRRGVAIADILKVRIKFIENNVNKLVGLRLNSLNTSMYGKKHKVVIMIGF
ncbi:MULTISPECIES: hypothetical protein [Nostocales]|jgi:hypothetical protein|uniref:Uncharacterized protein n=1 Tax=Dolichospermum flos-aquae UHCC 0037 TaxID=2590026 RepID=A0ACC7SEU2_DOLFA|nr:MULTISPECIES: hypothetical protein [Nostocales]MBO1063759.1 hypothetical protein [Anabaena sp. 54]MTJ46249.1 hypothetical protein [Dolichospermum flos-aquae UHCC 0037]